MGAAGDLGADQRRLGVEDVRIDLLQAFPAVVVVAVAGGGGEVLGADAVFLHGQEDLGLVDLRPLVDGLEAVRQTGQDLLPPVADRFAEPHLGIYRQ